MMKAMLTIVGILGLSSVAAAAPPTPSPSTVIKVSVPEAAVELLKTNSNWVFLTPAANPFRSASDLNEPSTIGVFNMTLGGDVLKFAQAIGANPAGVVILSSGQVFGHATAEQRVRLVVADRAADAAQIKGGVTVEFIAKSASAERKQ